MDSLNKRYFYKLSTNIAGFILSFVTAAIAPRGLGPKLYGNFSFLTNFFSQITGFLDMGTSMCFYNKLSQRPKDHSLAAFYRYFMACVTLITLAFVAFAHLTSLHINLWPGQKIFYIYLAAGWGICNWAVNLFNKMTDAYGLTVPAEKARIVQKFLGAILLILLYISGKLSLSSYFYYQYFTLIFIGAVFIWIMGSNGYSFRQGWRIGSLKLKQYSKEFYHYSHPLFMTSIVGLAVGILDRWLLQVFGGSIQQGFYGFAYQIGTLCFLFVGAMTPLLMREFAIGFENKDLGQISSLFRKYVPLMYSITAFFSCFLAIQAAKVIYIIGGDKYYQALIPVTVMAFAPIHQTYGQISSSVILAAGRTKLHRNIDVIFMLIGLPITYLLIAPRHLWGVDAGATGLAVKTLLIQLITVNTYLFFNMKLIKINFWKYLEHQIASIVLFVLAAVLATACIDKILLKGSEAVILRFLSAGFLYSLIVLAVIYYFPLIFGMNKQDVRILISRATKAVSSKLGY
ncbi:MAG: lipopolysaccharide biosynthesis protein [Candidatus Omnitrophica bacterium]|nr:lipopolysaccharide biosynthesis protein [Candidatus Omnitrophota bacterium]